MSLTSTFYCVTCRERVKLSDYSCDWCGTQLKNRLFIKADAVCFPYIDSTDVVRIIREYQDRLSDTDRRLLNEAMTFVIDELQRVRMNAQLTVYGTRMQVVFYSGDRANKYVMHLTREDRPPYVEKNRSWRLRVHDGFKTVWAMIKTSQMGVFGSLDVKPTRAIEAASEPIPPPIPPPIPLPYETIRDARRFHTEREQQKPLPLPYQTVNGGSRVHAELERHQLPPLPSRTVPGDDRVHAERERDQLPSYLSQTVNDSSRVRTERQRDQLSPLSSRAVPGAGSVHKGRQLDHLPPLSSQTVPDASRVREERQRDQLPPLSSQTVPDASRLRGERQRDQLPPISSRVVPGAGRVHLQKERERSPPSLTVPGDVDHLTKEVHCKTKILLKDIATFMTNHRGSLTNEDRTLLRLAMELVTAKSSFVWENAQLTVYCSSMYPVFYSGNRSNQYELYLNAKDRPTHVAVNREIRLKLQDGATALLSFILKTASSAMARAARP